MAASQINDFEIIASDGARAEAEDEASALTAARTLRRDAATYMGKAMLPTIYITYKGVTQMTITPERSI